jgi:hypothetical protein
MPSDGGKSRPAALPLLRQRRKAGKSPEEGLAADRLGLTETKRVGRYVSAARWCRHHRAK